MGWIDSFTEKERKTNAKAYIEQLQEEYANELEQEASLGYPESKMELDELKLDEEIDRQIDEAWLKKHEEEEL